MSVDLSALDGTALEAAIGSIEPTGDNWAAVAAVVGMLKDACDTALPSDTTLKVSGRAADAKTVGDKALLLLEVTQSTASSAYSGKAENLPYNSYAWIDKSWFNDVPSAMGTYGWIFTMGTALYRTQVVISQDTYSLYFRRISSGSWTAWKGVTMENVMQFQYIDSSKAYYTYSGHAYNIPGHSFTFVSGSWFDDMPTTGDYWLITLGSQSGTASYYGIQICINAYTARTYLRRMDHEEEAYTDWLEFGSEHIKLQMLSVSSSDASSTYSGKAANLPVNTFAWVQKSWFDDMSAEMGGYLWMITMGSQGYYATQIAISAYTGKVHIRTTDSGVYGSWGVLGSDFLRYKGALLNTLSEDTSIDTITTDGLWFISSPNTYLTDLPTDADHAFLLFVLTQSNVVIQLLYDMWSGVSFIRYRVSGNWHAWHWAGSKNQDGVYYAFGDSITAGQIGDFDNPGNYTTHSYPYCVGRRLNIHVKNKGVPGQGLITHWSIINSHIESLDMSDADLITVGWAYNDAAKYPTLNFGSYTDATAGTYLGYYFAIMKKLQEKCPKAQVILITGYGAAGGDASTQTKATLAEQFTHSYTFADGSHTVREMYDELEKMANLHGWQCINQAKGCVFNEFNASSVFGDQIHPTDDGYMLYGNHLAAQIAARYANLAAF